MNVPELVALLVRNQLTLATAESLTGGQVAADLVAVPGVSAVFQGGVVAYQNSVKAKVLGVSEGLLARAGSVDREVAVQMALGVSALTGARLGLATTGAAGPDAHEGKPVGTVFVAVAFDGEVRVEEHHFDGDRVEIRRLAERAVFDLLHAVIEPNTVGQPSQHFPGN